MKEHKTFECEYCGIELDEAEEMRKHENICECNPKFHMCMSCKYGEVVTHYETKYIRCKKPRPSNSTCDRWEVKE